MSADVDSDPGASTSRVEAIHRRVRLPFPWAGLALALAAVAALSLTIVNGQPLLRAIVNAVVATVAAAVGLYVHGRFIGRRPFVVAVHGLLGLFMTATGSLLALPLYAEGALAVSADTAIVCGILPVGLLGLLAGMLRALGTGRRLRRVAAIGLVVTAAWGFVAVAIVVAITVGVGDPTSEVTEVAVVIWVLFLSLLSLPGVVFWLDRREAH